MKQPKEKAKELIDKMYAEMKWFSRRCAKKCALACCYEIIKEIPMYTGNLNPKWEYWQAVKKELIK